MKKLLSIFKEYYYYFYLSLLIIFVAVMPHSRALLSMSQIGLALLWILEGNFKRKFRILKDDKTILILLIIFFLHIIGLVYTSELPVAFKDIKIKLPLLLFPVIIGTSEKLKFKDIRIIIIIFTISILVKTFYGIAALYGLTGKEISDIQGISGKISHIRYSLMLNISIFSMFYLLIYDTVKRIFTIKLIYFIIILWLTFILILLHSVTGWVIFILLTFVSLIFITIKSNSKTIKISGIISMTIITFIISIFIVNSLQKFHKTESINFDKLKTHTKTGNKYKHNIKSNKRENSFYINIYLCEKEIKEEWNNISKYKYSGKDKKNQKIKYTLIRYLSSKGLRKDKEGILKLNEQDIKNIENGMANYIYENKYAIYPKIYEILWQTERYKSGGNPQGHSVTQRIEFLKTGIKIIKRNFWIGVGTGDLKSEFKKQYEISKTQLSKKYQLRAHNQYITIFITFGIIGFVLFLFAYIYPAVKLKKFKEYLFLIVFIIFSVSMLNEDTLETQMGVTSFAFFTVLFLYSNQSEVNDEMD